MTVLDNSSTTLRCCVGWDSIREIFAGVFLEGVDNFYYDSEWFFLQGMSFSDFQKVFLN